jgi:hypothetical protein
MFQNREGGLDADTARIIESKAAELGPAARVIKRERAPMPAGSGGAKDLAARA